MIQHLLALAPHLATVCTNATGTNCDFGLPQATADSKTIPAIFGILFGIIGALAVLMIVIAGLRFVTGQGNPQEMTKARNTIIYALAGLMISVVAESIVAFALGNL